MDRFILSPGIASSGGTARIIAAIGVNIFFARGKLKYIVIEKKLALGVYGNTFRLIGMLQIFESWVNLF